MSGGSTYQGNEGDAETLFSDFKNGNIDENDYDQLADILENEGMDEQAEEVRAEIERLENLDYTESAIVETA